MERRWRDRKKKSDPESQSDILKVKSLSSLIFSLKEIAEKCVNLDDNISRQRCINHSMIV